eukprot:64135-Chlamydomonas_euryale.AAC.2
MGGRGRGGTAGEEAVPVPLGTLVPVHGVVGCCPCVWSGRTLIHAYRLGGGKGTSREQDQAGPCGGGGRKVGRGQAVSRIKQDLVE